MSENIKQEDLIDSTSESTEETSTEDTQQDPLKAELDKVQKKEGRTELEKAAYSLKMNADRLKVLGGDPRAILGDEKELEDEEDKPVTVGMLKKMQQEQAAKSAIQLAEDISNETERELVKYHLENSIKSTGNPAEDLNLARAIVNAAKNKQILEEEVRKSSARTHSSASSAPLRQGDPEPELTVQEMAYMKPPFNLTKEEVLKARKA